MKVLIKIFNIVIFPFTLVLGLLLVVSGQSPSLSPLASPYLPLLGLSFPILYFINIVLFIYWIVQIKWKALIPSAFLFLNLGQASLYFQWNEKYEFPPTNADKLKVITYNANLFGHFSDQWNLDSVVSVIKTENADITCLQEVYSKESSLEKLFLTLKKTCNYRYGVVYKLTNKRQYGMVMLSKFPILEWEKINFKDTTGNMAMQVDIELSSPNNFPEMSEVVRLYNIHLQSFRFNKDDYKTIEKARSTNQIDEKNTKGLIDRITLAYNKRTKQVDILNDRMKSCELPRIVLGDFNDVPVSYAYRQLSKSLNDAFLERGIGLETTYKGPFPSFRIDYILHSEQFECVQYNSRENVPGDHKLISAEFNLSPLLQK